MTVIRTTHRNSAAKFHQSQEVIDKNRYFCFSSQCYATQRQLHKVFSHPLPSLCFRPACVLCQPLDTCGNWGLVTNTPKQHPFHYRGLECKSRKSRNTWSNRQIWPWSTEWSRAKANRVLPREHTGHSKHPLPATQKTLHMDITRFSIPKSDWLYSLQPKMEKLYTVRKNKTGSWLWLRSWTPYCQIQT